MYATQNYEVHYKMHNFCSYKIILLFCVQVPWSIQNLKHLFEVRFNLHNFVLSRFFFLCLKIISNETKLAPRVDLNRLFVHICK